MSAHVPVAKCQLMAHADVPMEPACKMEFVPPVTAIKPPCLREAALIVLLERFQMLNTQHASLAPLVQLNLKLGLAPLVQEIQLL